MNACELFTVVVVVVCMCVCVCFFFTGFSVRLLVSMCRADGFLYKTDSWCCLVVVVGMCFCVVLCVPVSVFCVVVVVIVRMQSVLITVMKLRLGGRWMIVGMKDDWYLFLDTNDSKNKREPNTWSEFVVCGRITTQKTMRTKTRIAPARCQISRCHRTPHTATRLCGHRTAFSSGFRN